MKIYHLNREQLVKKPLDEVFKYFSKPENLARITPDALSFKILTPGPVIMKEGAIIDYTVSPFGVPLHWRTYISSYDPPRKFVDEQLSGPYKFWHHTHSFKATDDGTIIRDEVRYVLPFGTLGRIVHWLFVKNQIEKIFCFRAKIIAEYFSRDTKSETAG